jgi:hypothetical protein
MPALDPDLLPSDPVWQKHFVHRTDYAVPSAAHGYDPTSAMSLFIAFAAGVFLTKAWRRG